MLRIRLSQLLLSLCSYPLYPVGKGTVEGMEGPGQLQHAHLLLSHVVCLLLSSPLPWSLTKLSHTAGQQAVLRMMLGGRQLLLGAKGMGGAQATQQGQHLQTPLSPPCSSPSSSSSSCPQQQQALLHPVGADPC